MPPIRIGQQVAARRKRLSELDEHGSEFLACAAKMLSPSLIPGLMLDEFIVYNADALTREHRQDLAVALAFLYHLPAGAGPLIGHLHRQPLRDCTARRWCDNILSLRPCEGSDPL